MLRFRICVLSQCLLLVPSLSLGESGNEALWDASRRGDLAAVKAALEEGVGADATTKYGATALSFACDKGHLEVARLLLDRGAKPDERDTFYGATPLTWASNNQHLDVMELLIRRGASPNDQILLTGVQQGHIGLVKAVLENTKPEGASLRAAMSAAETAGKQEIIKLLEQAGAERSGKPTVAVPEETLALYDGSYKNEKLNLTVRVRHEAGVVKAVITRQAEISYKPVDDVTFESTDVPDRVLKFEKSGIVVSQVLFRYRERQFVFERIDEVQADTQTVEAVAVPFESPKKVTTPRNWPRFRGPGASGIADGQHPPTFWNAETGENIKWKTPIPGLAHSSPIVWGDKVFVTTAVNLDSDTKLRHGLYGDVSFAPDHTENHAWRVYCLDKETGSVVWEQTVFEGKPRIKRHMKSGHADSTPATDGKHVVACLGSEGLCCFDFDGKLLWKKDIGALDAGWFYDPAYQWGFASSPVIYKDLVILQCDIQKNPHIAAWNIETGDLVWKTPRDEICSWASPSVFEFNGRAELVTNGTRAIRGYNPMTGKEIWRLEGNSEVCVPTPILADGLIYFTSGYRPFQPIYAIKAGATGNISLQEGKLSNESVAWSTRRGGPYMQTPLVYGDHLYTCQDNGILACYEAKTGKRLYQERMGSGSGFTASGVASDGRLYYTSEDGDILVVKAGPKFEKLATNRIGEVCMATPAISDGMIFVRARHHVYGIGHTVVAGTD